MCMEGDLLSTTVVMIEKMEKELMNNCFDLLASICTTQTTKIGPSGVSQLYLASDGVLELVQGLQVQPNNEETSKITKVLNALCVKARG